MKQKIKELAKELNLKFDDDLIDKQSQNNLQIINSWLLQIKQAESLVNDFKDDTAKALINFMQIALTKSGRNEQIIELYKKGVSQNAIAEVFRLSQSSINVIVQKYRKDLKNNQNN
jgi:DNA-binding NarL/FixJ family response regulator